MSIVICIYGGLNAVRTAWRCTPRGETQKQPFQLSFNAKLSGSFKLTAGHRLFEAQPTGDNVRLVIVFAEDRRAREAAEHGDLANVVERIGNGALEEAFERAVERLARGEVVVKPFCGGEETVDFGVPRQGPRVVPGLIAFGDRQGPVEEIAHMGEDLRGGARLVADVKAAEVVGRAAEGFGGTVGCGGDGVPQEPAFDNG
jgi:hypothetical protein